MSETQTDLVSQRLGLQNTSKKSECFEDAKAVEQLRYFSIFVCPRPCSPSKADNLARGFVRCGGVIEAVRMARYPTRNPITYRSCYLDRFPSLSLTHDLDG